VAFKDVMNGLITTINGIILQTTDGGASWAEQETPAEGYLFCVNYNESGQGYAGGMMGTIIKSDLLSTSLNEPWENIPSETIVRNFPNPFTTTTTIFLKDPGIDSPVKVQIFNSLGQLIEESERPAIRNGGTEFKWEANGVPGGIYYYRIGVTGRVWSGKMILIK
jgi:hypothetical protein